MKTSVAGFRFGGISAGIEEGRRPDLALLVADADVPVAAAFTRNRLKGAPVLLSQDRVRSGIARAIVVNSGNANACTGKPGIEDAQRLTRAVAVALEGDERRVLCASTGPMGVRLPVNRILPHVDALATLARPEGFEEFAATILTVDRGPKIAYAEVSLGRIKVGVLGCAKGASMIGPNMATTLAFVVTDAAIEGRWLRSSLKEEVDLTFNDVSVDGEASPNDSLFLLASGRAGNKPLDGGADGRAFRAALRDVLDDLAHQVVRDGIGASRVMTIEVAGAPDVKAARQVARRVGCSPLVKTALFGASPDWGRMLCAAGNAGVDLDPDRVDLWIGGVQLVADGVALGGDSVERAEQEMARESCTVRLHLHAGQGEGRHVTCDLSDEYVRLQSQHRL